MSTTPKRRFQLGQILATPGAIEALTRNNSTGAELLLRHVRGDWGEVDEEDRQANEEALRDGSRLLSAYVLPDGTRLWIIKEAVIDDPGRRAATTMLLPEEY